MKERRRMDYTTKIGDWPTEVHINYQCPCGCNAGLIYDGDSKATELGQCCCGRLLWAGDAADQMIGVFYEEGVEYKLDVGSVTLPWGDKVTVALAAPAKVLAAEAAAGIGAPAAAGAVTDMICGMQVVPETAAGSSVYKGETFYFCSAACKQRFDAAPERYATGGSR